MGAPQVTEEPYVSNGTVPVYDADAHIAEPTSVWQEYTDPKFREMVMQCRSVGKLDSIFIENSDIGTACAPACIPNAYEGITFIKSLAFSTGQKRCYQKT